MTIVFDRRGALAGQPMAHAFIVGVSEYTHLPGEDDPQDPEKFDLKRLGSCALSAWEICRWLVRNADSMACKLGSIRLLISPSAAEIAEMTPIEPPDTLGADVWLGKKPNEVDSPTFKAFVAEARDWRQDSALANRDGYTFFYYSGHGLRQITKDLITLADFTDPNAGGSLQCSFELMANFIVGMGPSANRPDMARNQFYFVDCCRDNVQSLNGIAASPGTIWAPLGDPDDRATPVYMAAYPGHRALATWGKITDFCEATLACLERGSDGPHPRDAARRWAVTSLSLNKAFDDYYTRIGRPKEFAPATGISFKDVPLRWLAEPPPVEFSVQIDPQDAVQLTTVSLRRGHVPLQPEFPGEPPAIHPYKVTSKAGIHTLNATSTTHFAPYEEDLLITPLWTSWPIALSPRPDEPMAGEV